MEIVADWLGTVVHRLGTGDVAELRRLDPALPSAAVFWRLVAAMTDVDAPWQAERERRFAVILRTFAELRDAHRGGRRLGQALAEACNDEEGKRLLQLLRARKNALAHAIRTSCHLLVSKGVTVDAMGFARLVLSEDASWEDDERRRIARDYFGALARTDKRPQGDKR